MRYERGTFITIPNKEHLRLVSLGARAVFVEMCDMCDEYGLCFPSRKTLCQRVGMSENSIDRFIEELLKNGLITKSRRTDSKGGYTSNLYHVMILPPLSPPVGTPYPHPQGDPIPTHSELTKPILTKTNTAIAEFSSNSEGEAVVIPPKVAKEGTKRYEDLCTWLSDQTGAPIPNRAKQYAHLKRARAIGIDPKRLKDRALELLGKSFYQSEGLDWGGVVNSFDRKA